jgi:hypothetical protein
LAHDTQGPTKGVWWEHVVPHHALALLAMAPANLSLPVAADVGSGGGWQQHVLGAEQLLPVRCEQLRLAYRLTLLTDPTQEMLQACAGLWGAVSSLGRAGKHGGGSSSSGSRSWWHWRRHKPQQKASGQGTAASGDTAQQAAPGSSQLQDGDDDSVDADSYAGTDLAAGGAATAPAVPSEPADAVPEELAVFRKLVPLVKDWASRAPGSGSGDQLEASGSSADEEGLPLPQRLVPRDVGLEMDSVLYSPAYLEQYVTGPDGAVVPSDAAIPALRLSADVPSEGLQVIWRGLQELAWVSEHREQYPVLVNGP